MLSGVCPGVCITFTFEKNSVVVERNVYFVNQYLEVSNGKNLTIANVDVHLGRGSVFVHGQLGLGQVRQIKALVGILVHRP
jgi:hypothetical protein